MDTLITIVGIVVGAAVAIPAVLAHRRDHPRHGLSLPAPVAPVEARNGSAPGSADGRADGPVTGTGATGATDAGALPAAAAPAWGSPAVHPSPFSPPPTRAAAASSDGSTTTPEDRLFRSGFGLVACAVLGGMGAVLLVIGAVLSLSGSEWDFVAGGPAIVLLASAVGSFVGLVLVRLARRLEPPLLRLTPEQRWRRPGTIVGLSATAVGISCLAIGLALADPLPAASSPIGGAGILAFAVAIGSSAVAGTTRLLAVLSARRGDIGEPRGGHGSQRGRRATRPNAG